MNAQRWTGKVAALAAIVMAGQAAIGDATAASEEPVAQMPMQAPRIDSVVMAAKQPQQADQATIWYDEFDGAEKKYAEGSGGLDEKVFFGAAGRSMLSYYPKGERGKGGRKVFFGDTPAYRNKAVRTGEKFDDVYWRVYVRYQPGWTGGGPAKMSRATSLVSEKWAQAMIAHVWSSGESLTLDPASGVRDGKVVTTKYNDFENLHWLGNKPVSKLKVHSTAEAGRWVCVESRARLNTPGKKDGLNQLWIDGRLEAERKNLDWRGSYDARGINAVFLETYWNQGSPVDQSRWFDNFVISTKPIGPVTAPRNPALIRTAWPTGDKGSPWKVEVAADSEGKSVVWQSSMLPEKDARVTVDTRSGQFTGPLKGKTELVAGATYFVRAARLGPTDALTWSTWHQPFVAEK